jgi:hypothetical protein
VLVRLNQVARRVAAQVMHPTSSTLIRNSSLRLLEIDSPASGYLNLYSGLPASIQ